MSKTAVVTGGTRGIGAAIVKALIADGYTVVANYHGDDKAAEKFRDETGARIYKFDVSDFDECEKGARAIEADLGPVDVLINNAGITRDGMLHKMDYAAWHAVIETNLSSCFNMCRAIVPGMRDRKFGRIINISSINGQKGQLGQTNYSAAKAGMIGFTKSLALETATKGITVNAVCPGYIETDMTKAMPQDVLNGIVSAIPVGRMGKPEEISDIVTFLASDKASFVTGAAIAANGGQYMS